MKSVKLYSIKFREYTNCLYDTVCSNDKEIRDQKYLSIPDGGLIIREDEIDFYKNYGQGIDSLKYVGSMLIDKE